MAGPWEKYQSQPDAGPWTKYAVPAPEEAPRPPANRPWGDNHPRAPRGKQPASPAPGFMSSVNRGIASVGDAASELVFDPIDATSQFFGGPRISSTDAPFTDAMTDMGMIGGERDTGFMGRVGEGVGAAAGALLPFGAAANAARGAGGMIGATAETLMSPFVRNPATAVGTELLAGAGAGAGGETASRMFGEEWRTTGEVVGGLGAGIAPSLRPPLASTAGRAALKAIAPYTQAGGRIAAAERLQSLSPNPRAEADLIAAAEDFGQLSPAQLSGNDRFMALENTVRQNVPEIGADMARRDAAAVERLRTEATAPAQGATPDEARAFYRDRQARVSELLQGRASEAQRRAQERLQAIEPRMRATEASRILREELDAADRAAREAVSELYRQVPQDAPIQTQNVFRSFDDMVRNTPSAQTGDIPADARRVIKEAWGEAGIPFDGPSRPDTVTMREMAGLYQKMREIARGARAGPAPKNNLARLADDISAAILRDIGVDDANPSQAAEAFNLARNARRQYAETFEQGEVGRILNKTRTGDDAVDPRRALDATVGRGGSQALIAREDIQAALGDNANAEGAVSDYVNRRFTEYAVRDGQIDPTRAETFMRDNAELLGSMPAVRGRIEDALASQRGAAASGERLGAQAQAATDPRQNPAAAFSEAPVAREFDAVIGADNPAQAAALLARKAARDTTGAASRGLKASASDWLMRQARTVVNGQETLSGSAYLKAFTDPRNRAALSGVFSPEEMTRLGIVGRELAAVEASRRAGTMGEDVLPSNVNSALRFVLGTIGARVGAQAGAGTSGASLRTAGMFSRRVQDIFDKLSTSQAERLIMDAMQDKDLFVALLRDGTTPKGSKNLETKLSEWLASTVGQPALPDEEQGQSGPWENFAPVQDGALQQSSGRVADLRQQPPPSPAPEARSPYQLATMFTGMDEKRDAAVISGFIKSMTGKNLDPAKTAWCAAFVNSVLAASGTEGTGSLHSYSFRNFGTEAKTPRRGDIVVFSWGGPNSGRGHVGFYAGEETRNGQRYIRVLGGNQGNQVKESTFPAKAAVAFRRPPVIRA